jgi:hypothetical protein
MNIFNSYSFGLKSASKSKKMVTVIYAVIFLLAMVIALPFHSVLSGLAGNTMELNPLLRHFNYSIYSDFMNSSGKYIKPFITAAIWMGAFYYLFTVFFTGGILNILSNESRKFSITGFLSGCGEYFFRYLRLGIYLLLVQFVAGIIVFLPLSKILSNNYDSTQHEASLIYIFIAGATVFAIIFILILIAGDYAKIILFRNNSKKVIKALLKSFGFVFRNLFSTYALFVILFLVSVFLFLIYLLIDSSPGMISTVTILIMFIVQQMFVWLRVFIKIWLLGSELSFYKASDVSGVQISSEIELPDNSDAGNNENALENIEPVI